MTTRPMTIRPVFQRLPMGRLALVTAAATLIPAAAQATQIVNSVVATPSLVGANSVDATDWMAEGFALTTPATIGSVAVQVLDANPAGDAGQTFLLAIYANVAGMPGLDFNAVNQGQLYSASVTYAADGWNGLTGLQWQLAPGSYWLAVEAGGDAGAVTAMVLPAGAQPVPKGVAFYSGSSSYAPTGNADAFGLRIDTVAAVPEPASAILMLGGLGTLAFARKRIRD